MKTLFLMCGLPGSGKSTYVNAHLAPKGAQAVCPDDLRRACGHAFYGPLEPHIHAAAYTQARALMLRGLDVVIDECHVRADHLRRWKRLAEEMGYEAKLVRLAVPAAVCRKRRAAQNPAFPLEVIDRMEASLDMDWRVIKALFKDHIVTIIPDDDAEDGEDGKAIGHAARDTEASPA